VAKLLRDHGYSLQAPNKSVEGAQHPDRNAQFEHINATAQDCVDRGVDHDTPVFAVRSIEAWWSRVGAKRYRPALHAS
jgi:hypothetical protein